MISDSQTDPLSRRKFGITAGDFPVFYTGDENSKTASGNSVMVDLNKYV